MWVKLWDFAATDIKLKEVLYNPNIQDSSIISMSDATGLSHERHAPNLNSEAEVKASIRAIHVVRRHIFIADVSTEILITFLDSSKWLYSYIQNHNELKNNSGARTAILVQFIETVLRKNGEAYKSHKVFLEYDEIERLAGPLVLKLKNKAVKDNASHSNPKKSESASGKSESTPAKSLPSSSKADPRADPSKPKGYKFMAKPEAIASLGKRLCRNYNTAGSASDGTACQNTREGNGCKSKGGNKYVHSCNFRYDASGQDNSYCNDKHSKFNHK